MSQQEQNALEGKKKIGAFLRSKGAWIGAGIGTSLVVLGGVLEESTGYMSAIIQIFKTWFI